METAADKRARKNNRTARETAGSVAAKHNPLTMKPGNNQNPPFLAPASIPFILPKTEYDEAETRPPWPSRNWLHWTATVATPD
jgi:hypothetical protein